MNVNSSEALRGFGSVCPLVAAFRCDKPMYIAVGDDGIILPSAAQLDELPAFQSAPRHQRLSFRTPPRRLGCLPVHEGQADTAKRPNTPLSSASSFATASHVTTTAAFCCQASEPGLMRVAPATHAPTSGSVSGGQEQTFPTKQLPLKASMSQFELPHAVSPNRAPAAPGLVVQQASQEPVVQVALLPIAGKDSKDRRVTFLEDQQTSSEADDNASFEESFDSEGNSNDADLATACSDPDPGLTTPQTTLMIRNVPVMYTQEMLLAEWPNNSTYDFLYLPYSCGMQRNLTYAFVNFTTESAAMAFKEKWQKQRMARFSSRKPLNISVADVQGRDDNLRSLKVNRVKRVKSKQSQPLVFEGGARVQLSNVAGCIDQMAEEVLPQDHSASLEPPVLPMSQDPLADQYVLERFTL